MDGFWDIPDEEENLTIAEQIIEARLDEAWQVRVQLTEILSSFWDLQKEGHPKADRFLEDAILKMTDSLEQYEDKLDEMAKIAASDRKVLEQASLN